MLDALVDVRAMLQSLVALLILMELIRGYRWLRTSLQRKLSKNRNGQSIRGEHSRPRGDTTHSSKREEDQPDLSFTRRRLTRCFESARGVGATVVITILLFALLLGLEILFQDGPLQRLQGGSLHLEYGESLQQH